MGRSHPISCVINKLEWRNQQHRAFKWTPKTTALTILFGIAIPTGLIYLAYYTQVHSLTLDGTDGEGGLHQF